MGIARVYTLLVFVDFASSQPRAASCGMWQLQTRSDRKRIYALAPKKLIGHQNFH